MAAIASSTVYSPSELKIVSSVGFTTIRVVVLPSAHAEEVVVNAERYSADDNEAIKVLDAGLTFSDVMVKYTRI